MPGALPPAPAGVVDRAGSPIAQAVVDVVIVSYFSRDLALACLDSLPAAVDGLHYTATVVDNHSDDGLLVAVAARDDGSQAMDMGANVGFARANNAGFARGGGRYLLVLNPDTVARPGAIRRLVDFADAHPDAGVVAPRLLNADGSPQLTARAFPTVAAGLFGRRSRLTRWFPDNPWSRRFLTERARPVGSESAPFEVDWVSGAAMLVPRRVVETVGGFDESFFLFWEDADWCRRIADAGGRVWCVPDAVVVHDEGGTREHGWSPTNIRRFHAGAYRYWTKHHAPQPWNPLRWLAALLLTARAATAVLGSALRPGPPTGRHR